MFEAMTAEIAEASISGMNTYISRSAAKQARPGCPGAAVCRHTQMLLEDLDAIHQKVGVAVRLAEGDKSRVPYRMMEVHLSWMSQVNTYLVECVLNGIPKGWLRGEGRRTYLRLARECGDRHFDYENASATQRKVRGMEESLYIYGASREYPGYLADIRQGPLAMRKRAVLYPGVA